MIFQTGDLLNWPFEGRFSLKGNATRRNHGAVDDFRGVQSTETRKVR